MDNKSRASAQLQMVGFLALVAFGFLMVVNTFISFPPGALQDECQAKAQQVESVLSNEAVSANAKEATRLSVGGLIGSC